MVGSCRRQADVQVSALLLGADKMRILLCEPEDNFETLLDQCQFKAEGELSLNSTQAAHIRGLFNDLIDAVLDRAPDVDLHEMVKRYVKEHYTFYRTYSGTVTQYLKEQLEAQNRRE